MEHQYCKRVEFNIRGQICPATLLIALKEINMHKEGLKQATIRLSFLTDNRDATITIPDAATNMGYSVSVDKEGDYYIIDVEGGQ